MVCAGCAVSAQAPRDLEAASRFTETTRTVTVLPYLKISTQKLKLKLYRITCGLHGAGAEQSANGGGLSQQHLCML